MRIHNALSRGILRSLLLLGMAPVLAKASGNEMNFAIKTQPTSGEYQQVMRAYVSPLRHAFSPPGGRGSVSLGVAGSYTGIDAATSALLRKSFQHGEDVSSSGWDPVRGILTIREPDGGGMELSGAALPKSGLSLWSAGIQAPLPGLPIGVRAGYGIVAGSREFCASSALVEATGWLPIGILRPYLAYGHFWSRAENQPWPETSQAKGIGDAWNTPSLTGGVAVDLKILSAAVEYRKSKYDETIMAGFFISAGVFGRGGGNSAETGKK